MKIKLTLKTKYLPEGLYWLTFGKYAQGNIALSIESLDLEPMMTASINLPDYTFGPGQVAVKNWSENEGIEEALVKAEVLWPNRLGVRATGFVFAHIYLLHPNIIRLLTEEAQVAEGSHHG